MIQIIIILLLLSFKVALFDQILTNRTSSGLISGGKRYDPKKYPYVVTIKTVNKNNPKIAAHCTGTLLTELYVLTAAHCVFGERTKAVTVYQGSYLNNQVIRRVAKIHVHSDYKPDLDPYGDISVLKLKSGFPNLKTFIEIGGEPKEFADLKEVKCVCIGFGVTDEKHTDGSEGYIIEALVRHGRTACGHYEAKTIKYGWQQFLCSKVTTKDDLRMGCPGDSGGPMICNNKLYGVFSFIYKVVDGDVNCGIPQAQGAHVFVHYFLKWVNNIVYPEKNEKKDDKKEDDKKEDDKTEDDKKEDDKKEEKKKKKKKKKKKTKKSSGNSIKPYYKFHRTVTILFYCVLTSIWN